MGSVARRHANTNALVRHDPSGADSICRQRHFYHDSRVYVLQLEAVVDQLLHSFAPAASHWPQMEARQSLGQKRSKRAFEHGDTSRVGSGTGQAGGTTRLR